MKSSATKGVCRRRLATLVALLLTPAVSLAAETKETILARIKAPEFPARDFVITDYGARSGADCTEAIRKAVTACHDAGGGRIVVPPGRFLTGPVQLQSNVNFHIAEGATLKFDPDPAKYPLVFTRWEGVECMNYSPLIYAYEQTNVAVTGGGTLDGSASSENWLAWKSKKPLLQDPARKDLFKMGEDGVPVEKRVFGDGHYLRPNLIQFYRCKNVLIEGVTISASPMWVIHPALCTNVTVRGVTVRSHGVNSDGCDPESCTDALVEDCTFSTGDDCIALKSGRDNDGRRVGKPVENVVIRNCTIHDGHGGVTIGSEISGGARNVFVENIRMDSPNLDRAIRFKSNARRGGVMENIDIRNVSIGRVGVAVSLELDYEGATKGSHAPVVRNVNIENVTSESCGQVLNLGGVPGAIIENVRIANSSFRGLKKTDRVSGANRPAFENVVTQPALPSEANAKPDAITDE